VFSSEEYDENTSIFDDLFACFLNGQNIALIPGTNSSVGVMTVNCGSPYNPPSGSNCGYYITNDCFSLGLGYPCTNIATEMDGLTVVFSANGILQPGLNHIKLAIADNADDAADSNVFIRGQSFSCNSIPVFEAPSPCGQTLHGYVGVPLSFTVVASAGNGLPGESVTLDVTGDAVPLAGGTFVPPLPAGPAQPVSSQFQWTPTAGDVGDYHLTFTATDQLQQSSTCDVWIRVDSSIPPPSFVPPSPCGQVLNAWAGVPFSFEVAARAENSAPGESVTLAVTGDAVPLAGGVFVPPLPTGPAQPVSTQFQWTPTLAEVGLYHLDFIATDQLQQTATCDVTIQVFGSPGTDLCQAGVGTVRGCPCSNPPALSPGGCDNSAGTGGARLESVGAPLVDFSSVVFTTSGETPTALSIVLQGNAYLPSGVIYGQGVRCVSGALKRLYVKSASGGSITAPEPGDLDVASRSEQLGYRIPDGSYCYYAVYYRDSTILGGCPATSTFNVTQTQAILWNP
jgi:hypothetical protein